MTGTVVDVTMVCVMETLGALPVLKWMSSVLLRPVVTIVRPMFESLCTCSKATGVLEMLSPRRRSPLTSRLTLVRPMRLWKWWN